MKSKKQQKCKCQSCGAKYVKYTEGDLCSPCYNAMMELAKEVHRACFVPINELGARIV